MFIVSEEAFHNDNIWHHGSELPEESTMILSLAEQISLKWLMRYQLYQSACAAGVDSTAPFSKW
jgi:hypothetical protein